MLESVQFEKKGNIAFATLNREAALNALNLEMLEALYQQLGSWEKDPGVAVVVLKGAGSRSFCSGGDVKEVILRRNRSDVTYVMDFFRTEYLLDYAIHSFSKPILVVGHGLVMGGGVGLLNGAACRIVSETTSMSMPEISIGYFPDVGASWFLNQLPEGWGRFLGLTGMRLNASECIELGLADFFLPGSLHPLLYQELGSTAWSDDPVRNKERLIALIRKVVDMNPVSPPRSEIQDKKLMIKRVAQAGSVQEVLAELRELAKDPPSSRWSHAYLSLKNGSPSSACVTLEQLRRSERLSLEEVFRNELDLSVRFCLEPDFSEGVRAALIDKDHMPKWSPASLEEVSAEIQERYFVPYWSQETHPLRILTRASR